MKTDFVSTVSHELRTPLAAIYGAAMTLRRRDVAVEESQRERLLEVVSSEADRLARIVNDILWASRLESGRMSIAIERCDAAAIADEVVDVLRSRAPEGIEVVVEQVARPASGRRGSGQAAPDPHQPDRQRDQVLARRRACRGRDRPQRRPRPVPRRRRRARHPARGAGPDLREVLPARPEPHARRRRHRPRPLHLARARAADERPHLGRLRRPLGLVLLPRATDRLRCLMRTRPVAATGRVRSRRARRLVRRASARSCGALVVIRPAAVEVTGAGPRGPEDQ